MKYVVRGLEGVKRSIFAAFIEGRLKKIEKAEGCHFRDHEDSSLNYAGIFTCVPSLGHPTTRSMSA
jgi:hypothetical protein